MPEYLKHVPDRMATLYEELETDILVDMARKIAKANYWMPATEWQHYILQQMGATEQEILLRLSSMTGKSQDELKRLMREAGIATVKSEARRAKANAEIASEGLSQILNDGYRATNKAFANLTKTTARGGAQQLIDELDKAYLKIRSGAFSYDVATVQAIKTLADGGVKVSYGGGRTETLEVAVRRAVMTGVNQTGIRLNADIADQLNAPLMETTAHAGARPSHEVWQGKRFGRNGAVRIDGVLYEDFTTTTGYGTGPGLGGWNCRHSAHAAWPWESPTYSKELLQSYQDKSIEYNGRHYTQYEASQIQRYQERKIRKWKREFAMLDAAGQDTTTAAVKVKHWQAGRSDFLKQTGLKVQGARERVAGYEQNQSRKAGKEVRSYYRNWSKSLGVNDAIKTLAKYYDIKYNDSPTYTLLQRYVRDVKAGWISPNADFGNYRNQYELVQNEVVGIKTPNGILIKRQSVHFLQRVLGTATDPGHEYRTRSGVSIEDIKEALQHPTLIGPCKTSKSGKRSIKFVGKNCEVSVNPDDGTLIQTNPRKR